MDTSLNADHSLPTLSPPPLLQAPTFQLHALIRRTSLIKTTIRKCRKDLWPSLWTEIATKVLTEIIKNRKSWIFIEGDQDHYLLDNPTMDSGEEWKLLPHDVDMVNQMLDTDEVLLQQAAQITPAMRIGMIIWLVITSLAVQDYHFNAEQSPWDEWDLQARAITIWADIFSEVMHSKQRPSEAIFTDGDALAAFQSAMDDAGHQHHYQTTPDVEAWVTMRAALFPELKGPELACWHFNDVDDCSLCDERFRQKIQSEAGLDHIPPLHLVALWEYFHKCEDFQERIAFAVFQQPHLFLPEIVKPIEEVLAQCLPEKTRRRYGLHHQLDKNDPVVALGYSYIYQNRPSWQKIQDTIDSLGRRFAPTWGGDRSFPPMEQIFWFDMVRVLGGQYQFQHKGKEASWRPRVSLAAAYELSDKVLGKEFPPLNLDLLPEYVQRAVRRFRQATEHNEHTCRCDEDVNWIGDDGVDWIDWSKLDIERRTRYAAAYALLYSTDLVPLLGDDYNDCDACDDIRALYDCLDAISAGQITLGSKNIAKVLGSIKKLAIISDDCKFIFPDSSSEVEDDPKDRSDSSQRRDELQQTGNSEIIYETTRDTAIVTENEMNHFNPRALKQPEAYDPVRQGESKTAQIYDNFTGEISLVEYTMMVKGHVSAHDHVDFTNLQWSPPRGHSEHLSFWGAIPKSSPDDIASSHVAPEPNWSTEQPSELKATSNVAGPNRPKDAVGPKMSKAAKIKELHDFFVALFKKHGVPLGTTGTAEARLPWKKMTSILAEQGLEVSGWPGGVPRPEPRSEGKADKGISGFNADHVGALHEAMKAGQIDFQPLAGGSQTNDISRLRQREDSMEDEVDMRPTKKRKPAETRKMPKDFVAGKSVMKF
ncbi:hypothetical protein C8R44DRAFT_853045 [Mycena epipterygia]|nr:hypothetical protein C8R44DRAFT_853045 [Mycena epipterygia]